MYIKMPLAVMSRQVRSLAEEENHQIMVEMRVNSNIDMHFQSQIANLTMPQRRILLGVCYDHRQVKQLIRPVSNMPAK